MGDLRTPGVLVSLTSWTVTEEFYRYDPGDGTSRALNLRPLGPYDHPSNLISEELKEFVKARVAPYKYPRWIEFRDELPRTATGKLRRFELS